jgi:hypothetical protein
MLHFAARRVEFGDLKRREGNGRDERVEKEREI